MKKKLSILMYTLGERITDDVKEETKQYAFVILF